MMGIKACAVAAILSIVYYQLEVSADPDWPRCAEQAPDDWKPCWSDCKGGLHKAYCSGGRNTGEYGGKSEQSCCKKTPMGCKTKRKLCIKTGWLNFAYWGQGKENGDGAGCFNNGCDEVTSEWEVGFVCARSSTQKATIPKCPADFTSTVATDVFCPYASSGQAVLEPDAGYEWKNFCKTTKRFKATDTDSGKFVAAAHQTYYGDAYEMQEEDAYDDYAEQEQELQREIQVDQLKLRLDRERLKEARLQLRRQYREYN